MSEFARAKRAIIFGAGGQVGRALLAGKTDDWETLALDRADADMCDISRSLEGFAAFRPSVVINAAAYTAVDRAEVEPQEAFLINAEAPGILARWCKENGSLFVHYSTDYVFDGSGDQPWCENDGTGPLNTYGVSKLEGERRALAHNTYCLIIRTSWVYDTEGANFLLSMLRLGAARETLSVVDDQWGAPTFAADLARATWQATNCILSGPASGAGLYHLCGSGPATTWKRFAEAIFAGARAQGAHLAIRAVHSTTTQDYGAPASRPMNSRLDCSKFRQAFDFTMPSWEDALKRALEEMHARGKF